ncbi:hypothetical protein V1525DRAFT_233438 [Lipomyces kononenkoae]|uniref:Uncharacterized protein n=1 Tax=Lipomyces kononenkoae TaxID=34357 RepID=A0ACC3SXI3_LIPKO
MTENLGDDGENDSSRNSTIRTRPSLPNLSDRLSSLGINMDESSDHALRTIRRRDSDTPGPILRSSSMRVHSEYVLQIRIGMHRLLTSGVSRQRTIRPSRYLRETTQVSNNENASEKARSLKENSIIAGKRVPSPVSPVTEEGRLGRLAFGDILSTLLDELLHRSGQSAQQKDASARLANDWKTLDAVDPENEFLLLQNLVRKIQE